ncbi:ATP-binding protein [Variovorax boronicumulans]|uniref:ATP-binding protein n=1 Tax=Variovorax boronicumulans TaxID=436515 RepID=UPI001C56A312
MPSPRGGLRVNADLPINLDNCAREPIHIPGLIQSHGALLAFSTGRVAVHVSANAAELLGPTAPVAGEILSPPHHFAGDADVHAAIDDLLALPADGLPTSSEVRVNGQVFDLVVHGSGGLVIAEFELRPVKPDVMADFALKAHRAMERIKRQNSVADLMAFAVRAVRQLTGFDRVMAYRFRHDDSGDVVAEDRIASLEPFLGRRYPASDIPAQARRLYVVNTLRLIADVHAAPVPVPPAPGVVEALDMSHCVLRSVSPIHIEYLQNMGVGASMSISIVVNGQLWGMLACHHMAPLQVPYSVRMACDVLAQILAANVQSLMARDHARRSAEAADLRTRLIEAALHSDDTATALAAMAPDLAVAFQAHAVLIAEESKLHIEGEVPHEFAVQLMHWLDAAQTPVGQMLATPSLRQLAPALADAAGVWCGMLALSFDPAAHGWLVLLRKEQPETIQWGGHPEKTYRIGPLGPRLTPRGSFDVWRETVRDTSVPWDADDMAFGRRLLDELLRARSARMAEVARGRAELMAMLGHDLRDPLQSIAMAARLLGKEAEAHGSSGSGGRMGQRIQASSTRMARMISQVLDMSRLQTGGGLDIHRTEVDLTELLDDLLDEMRTAHPGVQLIREAPHTLLAQVDGDRMAQVFSNLISNARQHGAPGESIIVQLSHEAGQATLDVSNVSPPIAPEVASQLFNAFKRREHHNPRNRNGLGLGLYIAQAVVRAHGGQIGYAHAEPFVVFSVRFPLAPA